MKLTLIDIDSKMIKSWQKEFSDYKNVIVSNGSIFETKADAIVSPANSFGIMDGGLDGKLRDYLGMEVEYKVRDRINKEFNGELLVGQAMATKTGNKQFPYLISAPTMRVPQNISSSINAYLAMKAILTTALKYKIKTISCPGLGTLSGKLDTDIAARQMRVAYEKVIDGKYNYSHWREERDMERYMKCEIDYPPIDLEKRMC